MSTGADAFVIDLTTVREWKRYPEYKIRDWGGLGCAGALTHQCERVTQDRVFFPAGFLRKVAWISFIHIRAP